MKGKVVFNFYMKTFCNKRLLLRVVGFLVFAAPLATGGELYAATASRSLLGRAASNITEFASSHPRLIKTAGVGVAVVGAYLLYKWWTKKRPRVNPDLHFSMDEPSDRELVIMNGDLLSERRNEIARVLYQATDLPPELVGIINSYEYEFLGRKQFEQKNLVLHTLGCTLTLRNIGEGAAVPFLDKHGNLKLAVVGYVQVGRTEYNVLTIIDVHNKRKKMERIVSLENEHAIHVGLSSEVQIEVLSDGKIVTSCSSERGIVKVWDSETGELLTSVQLADRIQDCSVRELRAISCERIAILVRGDREEHIVVWNICSNLVEKILPALPSTLIWKGRTMMLLSNECLVRASRGDVFEILDLKSGQSRKFGSSYDEHNMVSQPVILPGSKKIAFLREHYSIPAELLTIVDPEIFIDVWDIDSGIRISEYLIRSKGKYSGQRMVVLPNGHLIVGFSDGNLEEWDIENNKQLRVFRDDDDRDPVFGEDHDSKIESLAVYDGSVVSSTRSKIVIWR